VTLPLTVCAQCRAPLPVDVRVCPRCHALQPSRDGIAPGLTIDRGDARIVVESQIGSGGMGVVWRGWLFQAPGTPGAEAPEPVALKVLRAPVGARTGQMRETHEKARELFVREGRSLERLSHPNVLGFRDLFEHAGALVLATEYVDGDTLEAVIARQVARFHQPQGGASPPGRLPGLPMLRAWYYFEQLLGALAAVHALDIVHRDIKPSNVFVRRDGILKLGDFGIARVAGGPTTAATGEFAPGTGAYMSPEQVLSRAVDARSDLYSAATVLFEMLTGRTPFDKDKPEFLLRKDQVEAIPVGIRRFLPQAPEALEALLARAFAKAPEQRFQSALEMGDTFRAGLGLPDAGQWSAQRDIARAAENLKKTVALTLPPAEEQRMKTLREFVVRSYKTKNMGSG
jgi:serine/threonine protein kinase